MLPLGVYGISLISITVNGPLTSSTDTPLHDMNKTYINMPLLGSLSHLPSNLKFSSILGEILTLYRITTGSTALPDYSIPREAESVFQKGIVNNPLTPDLPAGLNRLSRLVLSKAMRFQASQ